MSEKIAFSDENADVIDEKNKGIKIDRKKSMFQSTKDQEHTADQFSEEITDYQNKEKMLANRTLDASIRFRDALNDKTLSENKTPQDKDIEKSIMKELCQVALEMNNDENKPEGAGSVGLHSLILNMFLLQRNTINSLNYKIFKLSEEIKSLKNNGK